MIINHKDILRIIFSFFISVLLITGCEKKEEKVEMQHPDTLKTTAVDTAAKKMAEVKKDTIPDLTGNWTGTFDQRSATMSIIKQNGKEFSAVMTINYRQPLNKTINGTFDPSNNSIKMEDLTASRYQGKYDAQLLEGGKLMKGTFNLRAGGQAYTFNFKMK